MGYTNGHTDHEDCGHFEPGVFNWLCSWLTLHWFRCEWGIHSKRRCWWSRGFGDMYCSHHEYVAGWRA